MNRRRFGLLTLAPAFAGCISRRDPFPVTIYNRTSEQRTLEIVLKKTSNGINEEKVLIETEIMLDPDEIQHIYDIQEEGRYRITILIDGEHDWEKSYEIREFEGNPIFNVYVLEDGNVEAEIGRERA